MLPIFRGFLPKDSVMQTRASGVVGLQGGYPIQFKGGHIELDLPGAASREETISFKLVSPLSQPARRQGTVFARTDRADKMSHVYGGWLDDRSN